MHYRSETRREVVQLAGMIMLNRMQRKCSGLMRRMHGDAPSMELISNRRMILKLRFFHSHHLVLVVLVFFLKQQNDKQTARYEGEGGWEKKIANHIK